MKAILSMVLAIWLCGLVGAGDKKVDPVGTWKCKYGEDERPCTLVIKTNGEKITGTMSWPNQKERTVKDMKLKDANLNFSVAQKIPDSEDEFTFEFRLTVDGDKLKGKGTTEIMGANQEFDITGKREKKDK